MNLQERTNLDNYLKVIEDVFSTIDKRVFQVGSSGIIERNIIINLAYSIGLSNARGSVNIPSNVFIGGEVSKEVSGCPVFPDFIIHESHDRQNIHRGQHLILEAKSSKYLSPTKFGEDMNKLIAYVSELNFDNSVYLIINQKQTRVETLLNDFNNNNPGAVTSIDYQRLTFVLVNYEENDDLTCRFFAIDNL